MTMDSNKTRALQEWAEDKNMVKQYPVFGCDGVIPPEDQRPFSVAGCIAIWKSADKMGVFTHSSVSGVRQKKVHIGQEMLRKMTWGEMPPDDVIHFLANHVSTGCEALSLLWDNLVLELAETSVGDIENYTTELIL
ncbi:hypothetical protein F4861DRAFT_248504 [Xylaria intraflava]|nr:hypothetical protein F4861DRAFT_248504 [Xylaria intraflava]